MSTKGSLLALFALWLPAAGASAAPETRSEKRALELLKDSLEVPITPYEGEMRVVTRDGGTERSKELSVRFFPPASFRRVVVDPLGVPAWTIVSDGRTQWAFDHRRRTAWRSEPADPDFKLMDPEEEYRLMADNYSFRLAGTREVADRECTVVEVVSRDTGRLVQALAVDDEYGVVLERRTFGPDGQAASEQRFVRIDLPADAEGWDFSFKPPPGAKVVLEPRQADFLPAEDASEEAGTALLEPGWLPPGYVFESADLVPYRGLNLLHYRYTDGVDVLSLFQCPPDTRLAFGRPGPAPRRLTVAGKPARLALLSEGKLLEWGVGGRFVLLGRLGPEVLRKVAESLRE